MSTTEVTSAIGQFNIKSTPDPDGPTTLLYQRSERTWSATLRKMLNTLKGRIFRLTLFGLTTMK